jgi:TRAP-type mannitol/chloroaromatic compound transport system substrate-binding protein
MGNPAIRSRVLAIAALLLVAGADGRAAGGETVTLVTPVVYGTHLPGLGRPARTLARDLKKRSGGTLVLDLKEPGDGTKPQEILDKVSDGRIDAGFATAGFWAAKVPAATLFAGFPFGPDAKAYLAWFDRGHGRALYQEVYDQAGLNVHVIPCAFGGAEAGGWFAKQIGSKKDLEGLRMRIFGLGARVMSRLGAVPVLVPGSGIAKAFEKGEIDAAELYTPAVDRTQGLQDAAKIIYMPGWHQPETVLELLINKDRWKALGQDRQAVIEAACHDLLQSSLGASAGLQAEALAALSAKDSVRVLPWPADVLPALRESWGEIAREEGIRDYLFKQVLEDIEAFQAKDSNGAAAAAAPGKTPHGTPEKAPGAAGPGDTPEPEPAPEPKPAP